MSLESRTNKGLKNIQVAIVFYVLNLALNFFSRKILLDYLGAEVLGLNTTAQNLLSFLNLAELGIGTAISYTLYQPLFRKDIKTINEIVSVQGWLYRKIAWTISGAAGILMLFFPLIFNKIELPLWYAYGSFGVLLFSSLLGYFVNYKQIVLSADQKEYKVTFCVQGSKILKVLLQILAISLLNNGYVYWLGLEVVMAIVMSVALNRTLKKEYSWLHTTIEQGKSLQKKYPDVITKTKQLFFHKFALFALGQTCPLIIYAYTSLIDVAIYGNYMLIVSGLILLLTALLNGISAGIGNLVAEGDKRKIKSVFWELTSLRIWVGSVVCFGFYELANPFVRLWMGSEFIFDHSAFIVLTIYTYLSLTRTNDAFISAYGLYQDIGAPLIEAFLNIGSSILLGYYWGITGILLGSVSSLFLVVYLWKPYFLYRNGFREPVKEYSLKQLKFLLLIGCSYFATKLLLPILASDNILTFLDWTFYALTTVFVYGSISLLLFWLAERGMKNFVNRFQVFFNRK